MIERGNSGESNTNDKLFLIGFFTPILTSQVSVFSLTRRVTN